MTHAEYANALRAVADFYEGHEEIPLPGTSMQNSSCDLDNKHTYALVAKALGSFEKNYSDQFITISKNIGGINLQFTAYRHVVCERVVVGTKTVPAQVIPERFVEEHDEEIVEWKCGSILSTEAA